MSKQKDKFELFQRLTALGFTYEEAHALRRVEMTLQRWGEAECGDSNDHCSTGIERDEATGKPFRVISYHNEPVSNTRRYPIADREAGAVRRLAKIMAAHKSLVAYHQGDCRGCNLYILRKSDLRGNNGETLDISANYTRGLAVCA